MAEPSHPRGMFLVAATEFWERFSFYSLMGLLVLFLTASADKGGFGWTQQQAVTLYGFYAGLGFIAPALGGWVANRWLGERRAILAGGIMIAAGQFMLVAPLWAPALINALSGVAVGDALIALDIPLGGLTMPDIGGAAWPAGPWIGVAYLTVGWAFAFGLALIIMGTGLLKPTISSIVGKLYPGDAAQRERGFAIFMTCVFSGSVSASIIAGGLGEKVGWSWGFLAGGVGMTLGVILYVIFAKRLLGDIGLVPDRLANGGGDAAPLNRVERDRILALFVMGAFTVIYASAFYQKGGMLNLFVRDEIGRQVGDFLLPTTWFQTISTATFILLAHPLTAWLDRIGRGRIDTTRKLAIALLMMATGYAFFTAASVQAGTTGTAHMAWVIAGYFCFGVGDVFLWPAQIALASRLAPPRHAATIVGCWYLTIGVGTWTTGLVAMQASAIGRTALMVEIGGYCLVAAGLVLALRGWLISRMHDEGLPATS